MDGERLPAMKAPFFTVILPTYNRAALLQEAIESVLCQTFGDFELIIVDDHSTDATREVVASCTDRRVRYVYNDRSRGGAGTRNSGIFSAQGEWTAFLDDDDVWLPGKLELLYDRIRQSAADVGLIYTGYATYDFGRKEEIAVVLPEKKGWLQKDLLYTNCIGTFSVASIRTALLRRVGGIDERFSAMQDMELYVRIAGISRVDFVREKLALIRLNNADRISLNLEKRLQSALLFWRQYNSLIKKSLRNRHRMSSLIFICALRQKKWSVTLAFFPWTFLGLFLDVPNFMKTVWAVMLTLARSEKAV